MDMSNQLYGKECIDIPLNEKRMKPIKPLQNQGGKNVEGSNPSLTKEYWEQGYSRNISMDSKALSKSHVCKIIEIEKKEYFLYENRLLSYQEAEAIHVTMEKNKICCKPHKWECDEIYLLQWVVINFLDQHKKTDLELVQKLEYLLYIDF